MFGSKELAVVANVGSLVQPLTKAQYQARRQPAKATCFLTPINNCNGRVGSRREMTPTGWAGRAADYVAAQTPEQFHLPHFLLSSGKFADGFQA